MSPGFTPSPPSGVPGLSATQVRAQLVRNGWPVVPIVAHDAARMGAGKAPGINRWQRFAAYDGPMPSAAELEEWARKERRWPGTGVPCGAVVAIDADFLVDAELAGRARDLAFEIFGPTPFVRQGRAPKFALIYRAAEPMASVSLKTADGSGDGIDILAELRQFVAYGVHDKTLRPYAWIGDENPLTASPDEAPEISQAQVDRFLDRLRGMVELSNTGGRGKGRGGEGGGAIVRDAEGRVIDGREYHLTRVVYATACAMHAEGADLVLAELTTRAWDAFVSSTVLDGARWTPAAATVKVRALLDRIRRGFVTLSTQRPTGGEERERIEPSYPDTRVPVLEAERAVAEIVAKFFGRHVPAYQAASAAYAVAKDEIEPGAPLPMPPDLISWGARVETAIGKTATAIRGASAAARSGMRVAYAVPTHRLGGEIAERFAAQGVEARVYRGYEAADPEADGKAMCLDLPAAKDAREAGVETIRGAVCERKGMDGNKVFCPFHGQCGMTRQRAATPAVWLVPHSLLFSARPEYVAKPDALVIDEGIAMAALPDRPAKFTLDAMDATDATVLDKNVESIFATNDLDAYRGRLMRALRDHREDGPLRRSVLLHHGLSTDVAGKAHGLEWRRLIAPEIVPAMPATARRDEAKRTGAHNAAVKLWAGIWNEVRAFLAGEADTSGRLVLRLDAKTGARTLERRSLATIRSGWAVPSLLIDATLAPPELLSPVLGHAVEIRADIAARWSPHGKIRQIIGAPVTAAKLGIVEGREPETPRRAVADLARLIRLRAALVGPDRTVVVIAPMRLVEKLVESGLPENVETGHFGAISGIDRWAGAAGLICIGRLLPGPRVVEALAGVVSGAQPRTIAVPEGPAGAAWYEPHDGGVRLASGEGVRVSHSRHPDPLAELLRWQICEAGLIQAIGRLRALRRTAASPFFLDIIGDVPLPIVVDETTTWEGAALPRWADMAPEGVLLSCPADVMACFPELAPTRDAARAVAAPLRVGETSIVPLLIDVPPTLRSATYKRLGRYAPTSAVVLPNGPADLREWLSDRLGAIEWVRFDAPEPAARPGSFHRSSQPWPGHLHGEAA